MRNSGLKMPSLFAAGLGVVAVGSEANAGMECQITVSAVSFWVRYFHQRQTVARTSA
jgi:hypothetical protein